MLFFFDCTVLKVLKYLTFVIDPKSRIAKHFSYLRVMNGATNQLVNTKWRCLVNLKNVIGTHGLENNQPQKKVIRTLDTERKQKLK